MARIDVEKAIEELTLGEKVDLTAGKDNSQFQSHPRPSSLPMLTIHRPRFLAHSLHPTPKHPRPTDVRWAQRRARYTLLQRHPSSLFPMRNSPRCNLGCGAPLRSRLTNG